MKRTILMAGAAALLCLTACSNSSSTGTEAPKDEHDLSTPEVKTVATIEDALAGDWRSDSNKARDAFRHPAETLEFFGISPDSTVIEIWPGGGWYTEVLAPYLKDHGHYIAASFDPTTSEYAQRGVDKFKSTFMDKPEVYGDIQLVALGPNTGPMVDEGTADLVLTFRNVHNWMSAGYADKAFADMYAALKPGGVLGVVEHRLPSAETQNPTGGTGYVHVDYVKQLAADAGFEFVAESEINANPKDTADHPFGVWTLPPNSRSAERDGTVPEGFDPQVYLDIGESDRMTLKFVKPTPEVTEGGE